MSVKTAKTTSDDVNKQRSAMKFVSVSVAEVLHKNASDARNGIVFENCFQIK